LKEFVNLVKEKVQICLRIAWLFASLKKTDKKYQYYNYALSEAKKSKDKSLPKLQREYRIASLF
jgi:uncharacterized protein (DUF2225 family)